MQQRSAVSRGIAVIATVVVLGAAGVVVAVVVAGAGTASGPSRAALVRTDTTPGDALLGSGPATTVRIAATEQHAARDYWTSARMAGATADTTASGAVRQSASSGAKPARHSGPPKWAPFSHAFTGVRTVGALFYTSGSGRHFCTGSVVHTRVGSIVLTAAHCVYSAGRYARNMEFVPGYASGNEPYGAWTVTQVSVTKSWRQSADPDLDVAFLNVAPPPHGVGPIEQVTGALTIAFALPDAQRNVTVIGYNNTDDKPIECVTNSVKFRTDQMQFYCRGFWYGTSGGPWILGFTGSGTGTVFGVIGGYESGGYQAWISYSAAFEKPAQALLNQAVAAARQR